MFELLHRSSEVLGFAVLDKDGAIVLPPHILKRLGMSRQSQFVFTKTLGARGMVMSNIASLRQIAEENLRLITCLEEESIEN